MLNNNTIIHEFLNFLKGIYKKGFFHLLTANFMLIVVSFLGYLVIAYFLSPEDIGRIKTLQTYASIIVIVATLGFNVSTLKLCSDKKYSSQTNQIFSEALKYVIISSVVIYLFSIGLAKLNFFSKDIVTNSLAIIFFLSVIPSSINLVVISYYQALKKFKTLSKIQVITKILGILFLVILSYFYDIIGYSIGYILTFLFSFLFLIVPVLRKISFASKTFFLEHWRLAKYSLLANLFSRLYISIDIIIINFVLSDPQLLGQYAFALNFIFVLEVIPTSIQQISIPYFSEKSHEHNNWLIAYKKYNKILFLTLIATVFSSVIVIPLFIHYVFQGKYDQAILFFVIIIIGWFFRGMSFLRGGALIGLGKMKYNFYSAIIILPINIITVYVFSYFFSIKGVAVANSLMGIITFVVVFLMFKKAIKKDSIVEGTEQ
jgi:O-antigen/teichoic acid export membrane protein